MNAALISAGLQKKAVKSCLSKGALTPDSARTLVDLGIESGIPVTKLIEQDVLRGVGSQRYWLDEGAWNDYQDGRSGKIIIASAFIFLLVGALYATYGVFTQMI
jgi:hypothetical protein